MTPLPSIPSAPVLVFGGTTEGREAVRVLDMAGSLFLYSTREAWQDVQSRHGHRLTGALDAGAMTALCQQADVRLVVDAAHPFAATLHQTVDDVARRLCIPVVRFERQYPDLSLPCVPCATYDDALRRMRRDGVRRLLALTGVQTIPRLRSFWAEDGTECWFRILDRPASWQLAKAEGFPADHLLTDSSPSLPDVEAIVTKESGLSGGFAEKVALATRLRVPLYVVRRPPLPATWTTVTGEHGLRRAVEMLCPGFFPLRSGFTTGSCAAAAAVAALQVLLGRDHPQNVRFRLPDGELMEMPVARTSRGDTWAEAHVVKDAGDDPDVTDGTTIVVRVSFGSYGPSPKSPSPYGPSPLHLPYGEASSHLCGEKSFIQSDTSYSPPSKGGAGGRTCRGRVFLTGGEGVGRVTLPGLGLPVGAAAINPVPQQMIRDNLGALYGGPLDVQVSVPEGRRLAERTFNPRVGVVGGISIIGTRGIVQPFSSQAFVEAIRRQLEVAWATGAREAVFCSGARSEDAVRQLRPDLPAAAFVHYGNFVGEALTAAHDVGFRRATLAIMVGKAVKLAAGNLNTHSHQVLMDRDFLVRLAADAGCSADADKAIREINLARELPQRLTQDDWQRLAAAITDACHRTAAPLFPKGELIVILL